jgi:type IV pilus assembly protein PilB
MSSGLDLSVAAPRKPLGQLLREAGFISEEQLDGALQEGRRTGERLGEVVVRRGWASEDDIAKLLAMQWQLGYVERSAIYFDVGALTRMTREQAQRLEALPTRVQDGRVVVAVAEPTEERLAALRQVIGDDTVVVVVPKTALDAGVRSELLDREEHEEHDEHAEHAEHAEPPEPQEAEPAPDLSSLVATSSARPGAQADLAEVLRSLMEATAEANVLQQRVADLARRLERLSIGLAGVTERLAGAPAADGTGSQVER